LISFCLFPIPCKTKSDLTIKAQAPRKLPPNAAAAIQLGRMRSNTAEPASNSTGTARAALNRDRSRSQLVNSDRVSPSVNKLSHSSDENLTKNDHTDSQSNVPPAQAAANSSPPGRTIVSLYCYLLICFLTGANGASTVASSSTVQEKPSPPETPQERLTEKSPAQEKSPASNANASPVSNAPPASPPTQISTSPATSQTEKDKKSFFALLRKRASKYHFYSI
jgi:hypothetical protein